MRVRLIQPVIIEGRPGVCVGDEWDEARPGSLLSGGWVVEVGGGAAELLPSRPKTREPESKVEIADLKPVSRKTLRIP